MAKPIAISASSRIAAPAAGARPSQVLYLGEINDSQQEAWRQTLEVFDEDRHQYCELSLFPDDRPLPPGAMDAISVKLDEMQLPAAQFRRLLAGVLAVGQAGSIVFLEYATDRFRAARCPGPRCCSCQTSASSRACENFCATLGSNCAISVAMKDNTESRARLRKPNRSQVSMRMESDDQLIAAGASGAGHLVGRREAGSFGVLHADQSRGGCVRA